VEFLIRAGADSDTRHDGATLLLHAAHSGKNAALKTLLALAADPNLRQSGHSETILQTACANGHTEIVRELLSAGARTNTKGGNLSLIKAAKNGLPLVISNDHDPAKSWYFMIMTHRIFRIIPQIPGVVFQKHDQRSDGLFH
jgi:ankyrin repeat protein